MTDFKPFCPSPPAHVQRYVDAIGVEATIDLFLNFGGSELYFSEEPKGKDMLERVIGYENAKRIAGESFDIKHRVPLANKWLAACLYAQGLSVVAIARRLRVSDVTVRKYLKGTNTPRSVKR